MMKKLFLFGDSVLQGVIFEENKYHLYRSTLTEKLTKKNYKIINKSHMGATIKTALQMLEQCSETEDDSVALFEYGGNDCNFDWNVVAAEKNEIYPKIAENEFAELYGKAIECAKKKGMTVFVSSLIPIDSDRFFKTISANTDGEKIMKWLGDISMLSRWQEHYSRMAEKVAVSENCKIIDIRSDFLLSHSFRELICDDGIHPTPEGHEMIAARIESFL